MPALRFWTRSAALVVLLSLVRTAGAAEASWFGPPCNGDTLNVVPVGEQEMLVSVQTGPRQVEEGETLLQTADGDLWVRPESLKRWRAPPPKKIRRYDGEEWASLRAVIGLRYRLDLCTQTLWVDAAAVTRSVTRLDLLPTVDIPEGAARIEPGGYLNLDAQWLHTSGSAQLSAIGELGTFNALGYGASGFVVNRDRLIRLDTAWSVDDPSTLQRLRLGDTITRSSTFGQSVRLGGVQWGRQFSLRPDIITYPLPSLRGSAALASSVDVYVNQSLRSNQDLPSGPFELNRVPVVAGSGDVQLVVKDVLGREQVVSVPFYAAPILLRKDLADYTVEAGWLRDNYAINSADYGRFLLSGTYRKGLSDTFTAESHVEILHEQELLALSGFWLQPALGVFSAGLAGSGTVAGLGGGAQAGFERISPSWNLAIEMRRGTRHFARAGDGSDALRRSDLLRLGFAPHPGGSLSFSYLRQEHEATGDVRILGLTYTYSFARNWIFFANASQATSKTRDYSEYVGINWQFGRSLLASSDFTHDRQNSVERLTVQKTMQSALDYSWRASAESGAGGRQDVQGLWAQERGTLSADAEHVAGNNNYRVGYSTGLAWLGHDAFWTRPIDGSFAVVDTQGVPDVRIYKDEQPAGRTSADGKLLVPNLRTYETTQLRIEDSDVPIQYEIPDLRQPIFLPTRGGTRALFAVRSSAGLTVRLRLSDGSVVPVGAQVITPDHAESLPVGFDGQAYLDHPLRERRVDVRWAGHHCIAHWPMTDSGTVEALCKQAMP